MDARDWWYRMAGAVAGVPLAWRDAERNQRWSTADRRFLVIRHPRKKPNFYDVLLNWLEERHPDLRTRFELQRLPCHVRDWHSYVLCIPWLQDPVQAWSPTAYAQANRLAADCDARAIPIINRVDRLAAAGKAAGAALIASAGIRTARMARITDPALFRETRCGLDLPLFVREDWRHCGPVIRVDSEAEMSRVPLSQFRRPVAVEYIDVRSPSDGLFRKYRYLAAGEIGFPLSMHPSKHWFVKGSDTEFSASLRDEELDFLVQPDPNGARLQAARRALGLDFVAFDYSYDRNGQLIVWEANPFPAIHFGSEHRRYRWPAVSRVLAAMTRLYLNRARLPIPIALADSLHWEADAVKTRAA